MKKQNVPSKLKAVVYVPPKGTVKTTNKDRKDKKPVAQEIKMPTYIAVDYSKKRKNAKKPKPEKAPDRNKRSKDKKK